jgi:hypothetical protein
MNIQLLQGDGFEVRRVDLRVFVLRVAGNLSRSMMTQTLAAIWALSDWSQPWGIVVTMDPKATYEVDVLHHDIPPEDRRSVGAAIVTPNLLHRMMINSVSIGLRLARFHLTAHLTEDEAIEKMTQRVLEVQAHKRNF